MSDPLQPCDPLPPPPPSSGYKTTLIDVVEFYYSSGFLMMSAILATLILGSLIVLLWSRRPSSGYRVSPSPLRLSFLATAILTVGIVTIFTSYDFVSNAVTEPRCPDWEESFVFADWQNITTLTLVMVHAWAIACFAIAVWGYLRRHAHTTSKLPE